MNRHPLGQNRHPPNSSTPIRPPSRAGFTMVEIMVTLAFLSVAAALATPSIMLLAPNMALKTAARDLYSKMQEAKMRAINENKRVSVRINQAQSYYFVDTDGNGAYTASATDTFTDTNGDGAYNINEPYNDVDGNQIYSGEIAINFKDYGYGIDLGTGTATKNWDGDDCNQAAVITFNSRGTSGSGSIFLENRNQDVSYAITAISAGSIRTRKYSGATPFNKKYWN